MSICDVVNTLKSPPITGLIVLISAKSGKNMVLTDLIPAYRGVQQQDIYSFPEPLLKGGLLILKVRRNK